MFVCYNIDMMEDNEIIASVRLSEVLRKLREASGLTQRELAEKLNVSRQTVNYVEKNRVLPNRELLVKWVDITIMRRVKDG